MRYVARLTDSAGNIRAFEFEADTNELASHHVAHCCSDSRQMELTFGDDFVGPVVLAEFRREYAFHYHTAVRL